MISKQMICSAIVDGERLENLKGQHQISNKTKFNITWHLGFIKAF